MYSHTFTDINRPIISNDYPKPQFTVYLRPGTQAPLPLKSLLEVKNGSVGLQLESRNGDMVVLGIYTLPSFAQLGFHSCGLLGLSPKGIAKNIHVS